MKEIIRRVLTNDIVKEAEVHAARKRQEALKNNANILK